MEPDLYMYIVRVGMSQIFFPLLYTCSFHIPRCYTFLFNGVYVLIAAPDSSCLSLK